MSLFAISDTHLSLGQNNKYMDIFKGWENYVEKLKTRWNAVVGSGDLTVISGDVSWSMRITECFNDFDFINKLNGEKIIIKGNHDYWWTTMKKMENFLQLNNFDTISFLNNNSFKAGNFAVTGTRGWFFDSSRETENILLRERERLKRSIESALEQNLEPIVFLHYPPILDGVCEEEIFSVLTEYKIKRCYFGHIHGETTGRYDNFTKGGITFSLISCDRLNFRPKLIEKY